jgi:hypothetical protein
MTTTLFAHFDGNTLVPDGPVDLPVGTALRVQVEVYAENGASTAAPTLPLTTELEAIRAMAKDPQKPWRPLDIKIDPELSNAIALDPEFNIEES